MRDVEVQAVHVKIAPSEAIEYKRNLLEIQLHLVGILRAVINMKDLRKSEFKLKSEARAKMREIMAETDKILGELPLGEEISKGVLKKEMKGLLPAKKGAKEIKEKEKIDAELREIKRQLEKLGYSGNPA